MIDDKVIALHQWVVDESEKQPMWWAEHLAWAYVAVGLVADTLTWSGGAYILMMTVDLFVGGVYLLSTCSQLTLQAVGSNGLSRMTSWAFAAGFVGAMMLSPEPWKAARVLHETIGLSFLYFAICHPPRPRPRRQAVAKGGAA